MRLFPCLVDYLCDKGYRYDDAAKIARTYINTARLSEPAMIAAQEISDWNDDEHDYTGVLEDYIREFEDPDRLSKSPSFKHVYFIHRGQTTQDFIADRSGWIWFDEVGLLGERKIYPTDSDASDALNRYARECL